ncbi:MAG: acetyl-CoA carboxylase carboxyltransferase subunit [Candidatus Lambdaproteobacteria bacterium]|nr:acetyl-CoA carboxylase carboxyltransferase subunit [Candidatus Lambdaproteobacteria bacterium]
MAFSLDNPLAPQPEPPARPETEYDRAVARGEELLAKPVGLGGPARILQQHAKGRMTVLERVRVLTDKAPNILFQNWGPHLDGASIFTAILEIDGRDVAVYGHDFTQRAGSMDATNGAKLAKLLYMAAKQGIPVIGMNDSAGAFVPAGVGGLDGYAEAFTAMRRINGVVPAIMIMFGFNAGGGSYLPRQASYVIQPANTFFGLTGPDVVREALGEDITPDQLGGPQVHSASGVVDLTAHSETDALRLARKLLSYLPDNNHSAAPFSPTSDPIDVYMEEEAILLHRVLTTPNSGFNTPFEIGLFLQQMVDHGDFFEIQPRRARNIITAYGRMGGHVVGFVANNSAVSSGYIDVDAARKATRFIRFCNLYNIPMVFVEDVTGFAPGSAQERAGIVQAGRALLDAIVDLRVPRLLLIVRNAYGGAYASFNNYATGADAVFALPTARIAVMGPAGRQFIYKDEFREIMATYQRERKQDEAGAAQARDRKMAELTRRYEQELMNPEEALKLGSVSRIVMPGYSRQVVGEFLQFAMRHYTPSAMGGVQRE